jgi:hypothetical protein
MERKTTDKELAICFFGTDYVAGKHMKCELGCEPPKGSIKKKFFFRKSPFFRI